MGNINILTSDIYNLISAGEVIETPVGALKEIVENAIDADCNGVSIIVENGGFGLISVSDDGTGMLTEDVEKAFLKHATSKLLEADDLFSIGTLGFRGEALPSIAAVSRVKLTTRSIKEDVGVSVTVENGQIISKDYVPFNRGTTIEVRDLFYNTPARKKFLKSEGREAAEITKFVQKLILTNPSLAVNYVLDGKTIYNFKGESLETALFTVYGKECLDNILPVNYHNRGVDIRGYIGTPEYSKANKTYQTLSVNGRYIVDANIAGAIMQAYKPYLMTRKFPFFVLDVAIDVSNVDVNVHPKKQEVRFADSRFVCAQFYHAVTEALTEYSKKRVDLILHNETSESEPSIVITDRRNIVVPPTNTAPIASYGSVQTVKELIMDEDLDRLSVHQQEDIEQIELSSQQSNRERELEAFIDFADKTITVKNARRMIGLPTEEGAQISHSITLTRESADYEQQTFISQARDFDLQPSEEDLLFERARILGAAFKTYLILELDDKLIFVDQHAAHERILFEKFMLRKRSDYQTVMFPYVFTVSTDEADFILNNIDLIKNAGVVVEHFGDKTFRITEVLTLLSDIKMSSFVDFLLAQIDSFKVDDRTLIVEKLAKEACKAAVKAGHMLSEEEIRYILKNVADNKLLQCPHGRPLYYIMTKKDFEQQFKRIV